MLQAPMLQIRLKKVAPSEGSPGPKHLPAAETFNAACPDHLVLADLHVAKGIGSATASSLVKTIGRRSRRQLGERVHFCVRCDFPIAIYGRLSPCEHAFCLDCARSDSLCYLCDERIQKIQTIKMMEGFFICAAPHCLKSFLKRSEFESHIHETYAHLLQPNTEKMDGNESEGRSKSQVAASASTRQLKLHHEYWGRRHGCQASGYEIVDFEVYPCSIKYDADAMSKNEMYKPFSPVNCPQDPSKSQPIREQERVSFTYEVEFVKSDVRWPSRWDAYLKMEGARVHWFSILNSLMVIFFLAGIVFVIFLRTVRRDLTRYEELDKESQAQMNVELSG